MKKRVIVSWAVLAMAAAAIGLLAWCWVSGGDARQYIKTQMLMEDAVADYRSAHGGVMPVLSDATVSLEKLEVTCSIIDVCSLVGAGNVFEGVPDGCAALAGGGNDNCDGGGCFCNGTHHYIWLVDSDGKVLSQCSGSGCDNNNEDGYQGIWP